MKERMFEKYAEMVNNEEANTEDGDKELLRKIAEVSGSDIGDFDASLKDLVELCDDAISDIIDNNWPKGLNRPEDGADELVELVKEYILYFL